MQREKITFIAIGLGIIIAYLVIVSKDFGPIPRAKLDRNFATEAITFKPKVSSNEASRSLQTQTAQRETSQIQEVSDQQEYGAVRSTMLARKIAGRWLMAGDILVDEDQLLAGQGDDQHGIVSISEINLWPDGIIPVDVQVDSRKNRVNKAMRTIEKYTSVRFVPYQGQSDYVIIRSMSSDGCQSYLGRKGGMQEVLLHPTCSAGQIMHELLHTLGLVHEHSREDRDQYITIHWSNIFTHQKNQFQKLPAAIANPANQAFDQFSLMMYPPYAFSKNNQPVITLTDGTIYQYNRNYISRGDIAKVQALYGFTSTPTQP